MEIYLITNLINNKIYIGKSKKKNPKYFGSGINIKKAIQKYGKENFKKDIIVTCNDKLLLDALEIFWIAVYNSTDISIGYNISNGGTGGDHNSGRKWAEEQKRKAHETYLKNPKCKANFKGHKHSDESKRKTSESLKKSPLNEERKRKISESLKNGYKNGSIKKQTGRKVSEETRQKLIIASRRKRKPLSEQHKKLLSEKSKLFWLKKKGLL